MQQVISIRERTSADLDAAVDVMRRVYEVDGYPTHWPEDPPSWLASHRELQAWLGVDEDGTVLGHVGMHSAVGDLVGPFWSAATGVDIERLGVVARLFVSPSLRGKGLGGRLLDHAVGCIRAAGRVPVMDVAKDRPGPISFYEGRGWQRLGETDVWMPNGVPFPVIAFVHDGTAVPWERTADS